jgi:hypothetical protein
MKTGVQLPAGPQTGRVQFSRPFYFYPRGHMTQKVIAQQLIKLTLYKKQEWNPSGFLVSGQFLLKQASTMLGNQVITIDYERNKVFLEGKAMRLPKTLSKDLISLVQLKISKIIKHYVSRH